DEFFERWRHRIDLLERVFEPQLEIFAQAEGLWSVLPGDEELLGLGGIGEQRRIHGDRRREQREKERNQSRGLRRPPEPAAHAADDDRCNRGGGEGTPERSPRDRRSLYRKRSRR